MEVVDLEAWVLVRTDRNKGKGGRVALYVNYVTVVQDISSSHVFLD